MMIAALFGQRSGRIGFQSDRMSLKTSDKVRFSNSSCPVCTHTHSFVFNDLGSSHLRTKASFAGYGAPRVHQNLTPFAC